MSEQLTIALEKLKSQLALLKTLHYNGHVPLAVGEEKKMIYEEVIPYGLPAEAMVGIAKSNRSDIKHMTFSARQLEFGYYLVKRHS